MADVVGRVAQVDQVDHENYPTGGRELPPAGRYFGTVPDSVTYKVPESGGWEGQLVARIDPVTITQASNGASGYAIKYTDASTKANRFRPGANDLTDFLRSCGSMERPNDDASYRSAVQNIAGALCLFYADWEAKDPANLDGKGYPVKIKGMVNFPPLGDGKYQSFIQREGEEPIRAYLVIKRWLSQIPTG